MALPIHRFRPSSTQVSPSRRAVVSRPPATSEPPFGSVRAKAPIDRSANMSGSQRSRCSSEPSRTMLPIASPLWTPKKVAIEVSTRDSSSVTKLVSSRLAAGRPGRS